MRQPEKVIAAVKNLYLTLGDSGRQKYSFNQIAAELRRQHITISPDTVSRMVKQEKWEELLQRAKNAGVQKEREAEARERKETREETIVDVLSSDIAERRAMEAKKKKLADQLIYHMLASAAKEVQNGGQCPIDSRTLQGISRQSEDVIQILDGKQGPGNHEEIAGEFFRDFMRTRE